MCGKVDIPTHFTDWKLRLRLSLSELSRVTQAGNASRDLHPGLPLPSGTWDSPMSAFGEGNRGDGLTIAPQLEVQGLFQGPDVQLVLPAPLLNRRLETGREGSPLPKPRLGTPRESPSSRLASICPPPAPAWCQMCQLWLLSTESLIY